ncbi:Silencing defective 2 ubiquitin [Gracilaria domingensis]|nr:Silencing defective 2 ubiquitin [Gracilaria domingensis]
MAPVNVLLAGLPHAGTLNLRIGDHSRALHHRDLTFAINSTTGLPSQSFYLCQAGVLLRPESFITKPGEHTAFVQLFIRRALPGGKGGFGALLKGSSATKKTTNFDSCRDLQGRRLRDVRREQALRTALQQRDENSTPQQVKPSSPVKRKRVPSENDELQPDNALEDKLDGIAGEVRKAVASGFRSLASRRKRQRVADITPPVHPVHSSPPAPMEWIKAYDGVSSESESDTSGQIVSFSGPDASVGCSNSPGL